MGAGGSWCSDWAVGLGAGVGGTVTGLWAWERGSWYSDWAMGRMVRVSISGKVRRF